MITGHWDALEDVGWNTTRGIHGGRVGRLLDLSTIGCPSPLQPRASHMRARLCHGRLGVPRWRRQGPVYLQACCVMREFAERLSGMDSHSFARTQPRTQTHIHMHTRLRASQIMLCIRTLPVRTQISLLKPWNYDASCFLICSRSTPTGKNTLRTHTNMRLGAETKHLYDSVTTPAYVVYNATFVQLRTMVRSWAGVTWCCRTWRFTVVRNAHNLS